MKNSGTKKPTSIRLSDGQRARIKAAAGATGLEMSQILETALAHLLDDYDRTGAIPMKKMRDVEIDADTQAKIRRMIDKNDVTL